MKKYRGIVNNKVPLTEEDKDLLKYIYKKRLKVLIGIIPGVLFANLYLRMKGESWMGSVLLIPIELVLLFGGITIFFKRIYSIRRDYNGGFKEEVYFQITQKNFIDITNQYFIGINNPDYLFQEVDKTTWEAFNVGDNFIVYRTPHAQYYFNPQGKFQLL